jgi:hypothetical protein
MMKNYLKTFGIMATLLFASATYAQYCTPTVPVSPTSFINNFKLNSGALLDRASTNLGYENITNTNINLISNTAYRFDIGVGSPTLTTHKSVHVWIDMNRDGDFDDAGELTFSYAGANQTASLGFSNKNIGTVLSEGETRMRVAMRAANGAITMTGINACSDFTGGEVQDYKVSLFLTPPPAYCSPTVPQTASSYINNFKVSTAGTTTGNFINHASTNMGYENITSTSPGLMTNTAFAFNVGVGDPGLTTHKRLHVWIDMNKDGDFDDAGELTFSYTGANTSADLGFSSKNIGPVIVAGITRMRVALVAANGPIAAIGPCDNFTGGEVKDYRINLQLPPPGPCFPTSMTASTTSFLNYFKITNVVTGDLLDHTSGNVGYEDNTTSNVALNAEKTYRFNFGIGNPTAASNKRVHIWIDKNQDGDFNDVGEEIFTWTGANTTTDLQFADKPIGEFTLLGNTKMRIAMRSSNSAIPAIMPCDTFTDGEVEDYSIVVSAPIPPMASLTPEVTLDLFVGDGIPASTNGTPHTYRIPSLVTSKNGTLLAISDARYENASDVPGVIDLVVRRSTDNGTTWGAPITINTAHGGDACTVVDKTTGRIFVFYAYSEFQTIWTSHGDPGSPNTLRSRYVYSDDDGLTWSAAVDLTASLYKTGDKSYWASAGTGIQLRNGTLVIPIAIVRGAGTDNLFGGLIYSTDHGNTWNRSATNSYNKFDENVLIELNNGSIMVNSRNHYGNGSRLITSTTDLGTTWAPYTFDTTLIDPVCQGNILRYTSTLDGYDKNRILFSNPASSTGRVDGALRISYDEGATWAYSKLYQSGPSAYSSLAILPNGKIGVLYEPNNSGKITFKRFSLEDLTDSTDTFVTLGVEDIETSNNGTSVYPNPVESILKVKTSGKAEVNIYNVVGKLVFSGEVGMERKEINVSHLKNGLYFVKI